MASNGIESRQLILEQANERITIIEEAARDVGGPDATVEDVFDRPMKQGGARMDPEAPDWTAEQEAAVRRATHALGYGAEKNVPSGLKGAFSLVEAGLPWKQDFEETLIEEEEPSAIAYFGSPWEALNEKHLEHVAKMHGVELRKGATQYDVALMLADLRVVKRSIEVMPVGYALAENNPIIYTPTGQVQLRGMGAEGQPVYLGRTDREQLDDGKYRYQPDTATILGVQAALLKAQGDESTPIVALTTQLYLSRMYDTIRAGLLHDRVFGIAFSGRETRAKILDEPLADDLPLEQIPGELAVAYDKNVALAQLAMSQIEELKC